MTGVLVGVSILAAGVIIGLISAHVMMKRGQSSFYRDYIDKGAQHNTTVPNKPKGQAPTNLPVNLNMDESEEENE